MRKLPPLEIEKRSFEIISRELAQTAIPAEQLPVLKRVIHTTADYDYVNNLYFSKGAVKAGLMLFYPAHILLPIHAWRRRESTKRHWAGWVVRCIVLWPIRMLPRREKRYNASRRQYGKSMHLELFLLIAVGNAPTALLRPKRAAGSGHIAPSLIIGVPVGFVNVVESKEIIKKPAFLHNCRGAKRAMHSSCDL